MNEYSDIIPRRYKFPDNGEMQFLPRPTVNITDEIEEKIYFLAMTSKQKHFTKHKDKIVKVKPGKGSKLRGVSYIKTDHILSEDWKNTVESGYLSEEQMKEIETQIRSHNYIHNCKSTHCSCTSYNEMHSN